MTFAPVDVNLPFVERLVGIAREAGSAAMRFYGSSSFQQKSDGSPVTAADRASHAVIAAKLSDWMPWIPMISEEAEVPTYEERRAWQQFWLIDPLDGTKEFIAGNGEFTVNIALIEHNHPVCGVVYAPALETTFFASRDVGAWKRDADGTTTALAGAPPRPGPLRIVESRSHASPRLEAFLATLGPIERIRLGSSLKFCRVAEGLADLYPRFGRTMEWDVAAGDCVYRYSGAGCPRPSPLRYNSESLSSEQFVIGSDERFDMRTA